MILEQGRRRLRISDGYVPGRMGCRKIDAIGFIAMARERGRGSVELDSRFVVNRSETRSPRYARFFPMLQKDFCNRICQNRNHAMQQTAS
jgi:hypothetical protein